MIELVLRVLNGSLAILYASLVALSMLRYLLIAGVFSLVLYIVGRSYFAPRRISLERIEITQYKAEITRSLLATAIFACGGALIFSLGRIGVTRVYYSIADYGWLWFGMSIILTVLLHDAIGYWNHRLLHTRLFYRRFHRPHHESRNLTPWSAFSLHPVEAAMHAGAIVLIAMILPVHPLALFIFMIFMTLSSVLGHCGFEVLPEWFRRHPVCSLLNPPSAHSWHHRNGRVCLGLYFNFWDRIAGTMAEAPVRQVNKSESKVTV